MQVTVQMKSFLRIYPMVFAIIIMLFPTAIAGDKIDIGVCYGMVADNLPPAAEVIALYKNYSVGKIRLFYPNPDALQELKGSDIDVTLGVKNEDIPHIAASVDGARSWFTTNLQPYTNDITFAFASVGNEAIPGEFADSIAPAMKNLQSVPSDNNLNGITVTTTVATSVLGTSFPPSASAFSDEAKGAIVDVLNFLAISDSPLMVNVYPYFAYASDPANVRQDYALFTAKDAVVVDGNLTYYNLFDAIVDAVYWAMEKEGVNNMWEWQFLRLDGLLLGMEFIQLQNLHLRTTITLSSIS